MQKSVLQIHPEDNLWVALRDLKAGSRVQVNGQVVLLQETIPSKHKFTTSALPAETSLILYGTTVGKTRVPLSAGQRITTQNTYHATAGYSTHGQNSSWTPPIVDRWKDRTFLGYHRSDGQVGTRNYWLVIPLVFCENRNIEVMREALEQELGYRQGSPYSSVTRQLIQSYQAGSSSEQILATSIHPTKLDSSSTRIFPNLDGIKFLTHQGGCGGTRQDAETLCQLLAGYIHHPNVAGATLLSLGCQNAQIELMKTALAKHGPTNKPVYFLEQQTTTDRDYVAWAIQKTFAGCMQANQIQRQPAPLRHLTLGLECGGSDGFSGISANPALGHTTDLLVALGGKAILSEFPELNGVEQELINRCVDAATAKKFSHLMQTYAQRAQEAGSGFADNPSPGNIKDGLITDAMKSAGAAKKGGTSPIQAVLDYTEIANRAGLSLLCTPGNDVESTTGLAGSGANLIVFTTGLGTPTGNPISPTLKLASNTQLSERMPELIDLDAGTIITGKASISEVGELLLEQLIKIASGEELTKAERLGQDDFIPWKRGISL